MDFSPVAIKEANHHIQGLMNRVHELEEQVKELSGALRKQNEAHAENLKILPLRMNQTMRQKDEEIAELKQKLQASEAAVERLAREASERESLFQHLKNRSRVLAEISKHRDAFESILTCLSIVEDSEYGSMPEGRKMLENCVPRETDLLDSSEEDEDVNGNTNLPIMKRVDSGIGTSPSSVDFGSVGGNEKGIMGETNSFGEGFQGPEENPSPCFV